ncbi:HTH-type transcriptional regulator PerR [Defluviimonas aquaemixtae]|uniref:HTH-type transcriptional regulator PerR n=1 Tax=Albidovulum aquaemixtae TaxID=1542388 RepID=A0A2R8B307_9RHOB|nr:LysR family transcriptional regulator [Defluviimonas aquaemixtae]SPH16957.1 HTH-type transcriptional regulator PerR [Defluviimonas aquaemixtae]
MRVFEATGFTGGFAARPRESGLFPAAFSRHFDSLEAGIGTRLFTRHVRSVLLTVNGDAWLHCVTNALGVLRQSSNEM